MLIRRAPDILPSEITPQSVYAQRRRLMLQAAASAATLGITGWANRQAFAADAGPSGVPLPGIRNDEFLVMDKPTAWRDITQYNNFYEFGTGKSDPARYAGALSTRPWTLDVEGEVGRPRTFDIDDLLKLAPMEERIYRLRCVEGWPMVIPWVGSTLEKLIRQGETAGNAKYVEFVTAVQPEAMPGVRGRVLDWPYIGALRLDEARDPLTMLVF